MRGQNAGMFDIDPDDEARISDSGDEPLNPVIAGETPREQLGSRIEATGRELREALAAVLEAVAGPHPRPTRVARAIGLDKSLASRLVRAVQSESNLDLMHVVPSPGGLQIFADQARRFASPASIASLRVATEHFSDLLDSVPGGRASIDAQISESSRVALEKREHITKQASFKSMSFLLGHFCDVLTTALFIVPSHNSERLDGIEIHRRIGLRRMRPSTPLALLSFWGDASDAMSEHGIRFDTLDGERGSSNPTGFLLPEYSSQPMPELDVVRDGDMTTLVLAGDPTLTEPSQVTSVFRVRNGWAVVPESRAQSVRGYVLHTPCRRLVRELFIAESLYPDATAQVSFLLPGPRSALRPPRGHGPRHFNELDLTSSIQPLPSSMQAYELPGVMNHGAAVRDVLERAGHGQTRFRGWRCALTYPVALVEMMWWLMHPATAPAKPEAGER